MADPHQHSHEPASGVHRPPARRASTGCSSSTGALPRSVRPRCRWRSPRRWVAGRCRRAGWQCAQVGARGRGVWPTSSPTTSSRQESARMIALIEAMLGRPASRAARPRFDLRCRGPRLLPRSGRGSARLAGDGRGRRGGCRPPSAGHRERVPRDRRPCARGVRAPRPGSDRSRRGCRRCPRCCSAPRSTASGSASTPTTPRGSSQREPDLLDRTARQFEDIGALSARRGDRGRRPDRLARRRRYPAGDGRAQLRPRPGRTMRERADAGPSRARTARRTQWNRTRHRLGGGPWRVEQGDRGPAAVVRPDRRDPAAGRVPEAGCLGAQGSGRRAPGGGDGQSRGSGALNCRSRRRERRRP